MKFESKITQKWFRSILAIIASILMIAIMLCLYLIHGIQQTVLQVSTDMTSYLQQSIDSRLNEIQKNAILFELSGTNSKLKRMEHPPSVVTADIYQFCDQLRNFCVSSQLVNHVYIYYNKIDYVASNIGFYPVDAYFKLNNRNTEPSFLNSHPQISPDVVTEIIHKQANNEDHFLYVHNMKYNGEIVGTLVVDINPEELFRPAQDISPNTKQAPAFGIMIDGQVTAVSGDAATLKTVAVESSDSPSSVTKHGVLAYTRPSMFKGLLYIAAYLQKDLFSAIYTAVAICSAGILFCFLFGIGYSNVISRRNTKPLLDILKQFPAQASHDNDLDEYQYINQKMDQLLSEVFTSDKKLQEQQLMINSLFLNSVLQGKMQNEYAIFSAAQWYGVVLENLTYQVAVIAPDTIQDNYAGALAKACADENTDALVSVKDGHIVVLFNIESPMDEWSAARVARILLDTLPSPTSCGFGTGYDSLVGVFTSYSEALLALPPVEQKNKFSFYKKSMRQTDTARQQGIETMAAFSRQITSGRYKKAKETLVTVFSDYLDIHGAPEELNRRFISVQNTLLDELEKQKVNGLKLPSQLVQKIKTTQKPEQLQHHAEKALALLLSQNDAQYKEKAGVPYRAKEIIKQNLTDPMLGLYMIADYLEVSNTYLSSSFKNTFKIGVVQYINELRIEQAKQLILNTDLSIKEIANQVGFSSDISFIRVFKKYEDKTPTALRKKQKEP